MENDLNMIIETNDVELTTMQALGLAALTGLAIYGAYKVGEKIGDKMAERNARKVIEAALNKP